MLHDKKFLNNSSFTGRYMAQARTKLTKLTAKSSALELKQWLECRGEKKSSKKPNLIRRVKGYLTINKKVDPKVESLLSKKQHKLT